MAFAGYCKIDGVKGEATDKNHKEWISITNFYHSVRQKHSMGHGSGGLAGQGADFGLFTITHEMDKTTADLHKLCALGKIIKKVDIELCESAEGQKPYMLWTLESVLVTRVEPHLVGDRESPKPHETVDFAYHKISWKYTKYKKEDGSKEAEFTACWNLATNEAE